MEFYGHLEGLWTFWISILSFILSLVIYKTKDGQERSGLFQKELILTGVTNLK